jgi:hypothetical protein
MNGWLVLHLLALGAWIGCIATETIVEHSVRDDAERDYVARIHWPIDLYIEAPAFFLVTLTGLVLWQRTLPDPWLWTKAITGGLAVISNAVCVYVVRARAKARAGGASGEYERLDNLQHKLGGILVVLLVATLAIAIFRAG